MALWQAAFAQAVEIEQSQSTVWPMQCKSMMSKVAGCCAGAVNFLLDCRHVHLKTSMISLDNAHAANLEGTLKHLLCL